MIAVGILHDNPRCFCNSKLSKIMTEEGKQGSGGFWDGRLTRSGYIGRTVFLWIICMIGTFLSMCLAKSDDANGLASFVLAVLSFGFLVWQWSIIWRRLNDIRAGHWPALLLFVPFASIGLIVWLACARSWEQREAKRMEKVKWVQGKISRK